MVALVSILFSSAVVVGATQVLVVAVEAGRTFGVQRLAVEPGLQDRLDAAVAEGAHRQRPLAGGLHALGAVAVAEPDDAQAGAIALLGMRSRLQDALGQLGCRRSCLLGPADDPAWGPLLVATVGVRHVRGVGGMAAALEPAHMATIRRPRRKTSTLLALRRTSQT